MEQARSIETRLETADKSATVSPEIVASEMATPAGTRTMIDVVDVDFNYGKSRALHGINLKIPEKKVTSFIGPSGCGKSTLLRCFNRMNDLVDRAPVPAGGVKIWGVDITSPAGD